MSIKRFFFYLVLDCLFYAGSCISCYFIGYYEGPTMTVRDAMGKGIVCKVVRVIP